MQPTQTSPVIPQDKREMILDAARDLFAAQGFYGTAIPEIAQRAQVGTGTIYRYFVHKEALVNQVFQRAKQRLFEQVVLAIDTSQPAREQFHQFWQALSRFSRSQPGDFRFLELQDHAPYLSPASRQLEQQVLLPIWQFCEQARLTGIARDLPAATLMALIWGAFVGLHKACDQQYLQLDEVSNAGAEQACWDLFRQPAAQVPATNRATQGPNHPEKNP